QLRAGLRTGEASGSGAPRFRVLADGLDQVVAIAGALDPRRRRPQRAFLAERGSGRGLAGPGRRLRGAGLSRRDSRFSRAPPLARGLPCRLGFSGPTSSDGRAKIRTKPKVTRERTMESRESE